MSDPPRTDSPEVASEPALDVALAKALSELTAVEPTLGGIETMLKQHERILDRVATQAGQEQEWFWSRFSAFATLHAALLVFSRVGNPEATNAILVAGGLMLGALWTAVQWKSRHYIQRSKERLDVCEKLLGFRVLSGARERQVHASDLGFLTSLAVLVLWANEAWLRWL